MHRCSLHSCPPRARRSREHGLWKAGIEIRGDWKGIETAQRSCCLHMHTPARLGGLSPPHTPQGMSEQEHKPKSERTPRPGGGPRYVLWPLV